MSTIGCDMEFSLFFLFFFVSFGTVICGGASERDGDDRYAVQSISRQGWVGGSRRDDEHALGYEWAVVIP